LASSQISTRVRGGAVLMGCQSMASRQSATGPPGVLPSGEAVISLYGPEPIHEAEAIVDALAVILGDDPASPAAPSQHRGRRGWSPNVS
jgi:hypothetical protein